MQENLLYYLSHRLVLRHVHQFANTKVATTFLLFLLLLYLSSDLVFQIVSPVILLECVDHLVRRHKLNIVTNQQKYIRLIAQELLPELSRDFVERYVDWDFSIANLPSNHRFWHVNKLDQFFILMVVSSLLDNILGFHLRQLLIFRFDSIIVESRVLVLFYLDVVDDRGDPQAGQQEQFDIKLDPIFTSIAMVFG